MSTIPSKAMPHAWDSEATTRHGQGAGDRAGGISALGLIAMAGAAYFGMKLLRSR